jgi:hypothetical protein
LRGKTADEERDGYGNEQGVGHGSEACWPNMPLPVQTQNKRIALMHQKFVKTKGLSDATMFRSSCPPVLGCEDM